MTTQNDGDKMMWIAENTRREQGNNYNIVGHLIIAGHLIAGLLCEMLICKMQRTGNLNR